MRILGQVMSIQPLAIVVSLPNQLFAHVPITQITSQLTQRLESTSDNDDDELDDDRSESPSRAPELTELFYIGQYVRAVVISTHAPGTTDVAGLGRVRDDAVKASRRVELSLLPEKVNSGVRKVDLKVGYVSPFQRRDRRGTHHRPVLVCGCEKHRGSWIPPRAWCIWSVWIPAVQRRSQGRFRRIKTTCWGTHTHFCRQNVVEWSYLHSHQ